MWSQNFNNVLGNFCWNIFWLVALVMENKWNKQRKNKWLHFSLSQAAYILNKTLVLEPPKPFLSDPII